MNDVSVGLIDNQTIGQCLAALITDPMLLDEHNFEKEDFAEPFYMLIYSTVYNLYNSGVNVIDIMSIDTYLSNYNKQYKSFQENNGYDYINGILELYQKENFLYYYLRLKKLSCLRYWESIGHDTRSVYNPYIVEETAQEQERVRFDSMTVDDMIDIIDEQMVNEAKLRFSSKTNHEGQLAGKGMRELKESFKQAPDYGVPLQSSILSTIARGCRLGKFYLRSSNSGGGKTRTGIADMTNICVPYKYDWKKKEWDYSGFNEPVLVISTELSVQEVQTIIQAFVSGVEEGHIRDGKYKPGEEEIVDKAIEYIEEAPFYIEHIPDFGIRDIVQIIKKYKREKGVCHFFFDYIHMSNQLIMEIAEMSKGMKLREDQILFLFSDALKNLCNRLNIFILSSTQLNGTYKDSAEKDETMLRGAKNLADRLDLGEISLEPSPAEMKMLEKITHNMINCPTPNLIRHIYKLRGGRWSKIKIVQHANLGTGRTTDLFVLNKKNEVIDIPVVDIRNINSEHIEQVESIIEENSVDIQNMPEDISDAIYADIDEEEEKPKRNIFDW